MDAPFLIAETPRGGPFGHRFIIPPGTALLSTDVEGYFQRAALGKGSDFIAVSRQVTQHLPNGSVREGTETLLLAGVEINEMSARQMNQVGRTLTRRLYDLEKLVTKDINWEEAGRQTLIIRGELADWLRTDIAEALVLPVPFVKGCTAQTGHQCIKDERSAILIGSLLGLAVGGITLFIWYF